MGEAVTMRVNRNTLSCYNDLFDGNHRMTRRELERKWLSIFFDKKSSSKFKPIFSGWFENTKNNTTS